MRNPGTLHIRSLDGDWGDKDIVILHACFQLLTDFVEEELSRDMVDWEHTEEKKNARKEIDDLYNWWKDRLLKEESGEIDVFLRADDYEADNQMLIRLIMIRKHLWT